MLSDKMSISEISPHPARSGPSLFGGRNGKHGDGGVIYAQCLLASWKKEYRAIKQGGVDRVGGMANGDLMWQNSLVGIFKGKIKLEGERVEEEVNCSSYRESGRHDGSASSSVPMKYLTASAPHGGKQKLH